MSRQDVGEDRPLQGRLGDGAIENSGVRPYPASVRTRTLLILAVGLGFMILAAGVVQLLRIAGEDPADVEYFELGQAVEVGDLTVVVETSDETADEAQVTVRLGGVTDADGADEFRLVVPGRSLSATATFDGDCGATTVELQTCVLRFDLDDAPGGGRILLYRRGDDVARWELSDG